MEREYLETHRPKRIHYNTVFSSLSNNKNARCSIFDAVIIPPMERMLVPGLHGTSVTMHELAQF